MKSKWFDTISQSYMQNYSEVESARSNFETQRWTVLEQLHGPVETALKSADVAVVKSAVRHADGWEDWWLRGAYLEARRKDGKRDDRHAAVTIGIGIDETFVGEQGIEFAFGCYLFFSMGASRFRKLSPAIKVVAEPMNLTFGHDGGLYIRTAWIKPGDDRFSLVGFAEEVERLPALYKKFDAPLAAANLRLEGTDDA